MLAGILLDLEALLEETSTDLWQSLAASARTIFVVLSKIEIDAADEELSQSSRILGSFDETKDS